MCVTAFFFFFFFDNHLFGKELFIRYTVHVLRGRLSMGVCVVSFSFGDEGGL